MRIILALLLLPIACSNPAPTNDDAGDVDACTLLPGDAGAQCCVLLSPHIRSCCTNVMQSDGQALSVCLECTTDPQAIGDDDGGLSVCN